MTLSKEVKQLATQPVTEIPLQDDQCEEMKVVIQRIQDLTTNGNGHWVVDDYIFTTLGGVRVPMSDSIDIVPRVGYCKNGSALLTYDLYQRSEQDTFDDIIDFDPSKAPLFQRIFVVTDGSIQIVKQRPNIPDITAGECLADFDVIIDMLRHQKEEGVYTSSSSGATHVESAESGFGSVE